MIENLDKVPNIKQLYLGKNRITEITGLEHLKNLESITLGPNKLTNIGDGLNVLKGHLK